MQSTQEKWLPLPIPGLESRYEVSDWGRIRSLYSRSGAPSPRILKGGTDNWGYKMFSAPHVAGRQLQRKFHVLVMLAFVGPRPEGMEVRHLDGDPSNNALSNLAYGTHSENMLDKVRHGTHYWARKTHCPAGHPYDESNTYHTKRGTRACRTCIRQRARAKRARLVPTARG